MIKHTRASTSRLHNLQTRFPHARLLLYWPVYLMMFFFVEWLNPPSRCHLVQCWLDELIPFCELFLIPYLMWFVLLAWTSVYTLLHEPEVFRRFMRFIILTYTAAIVCYIIWPTCQQLRPAVMPRQNVLTAIMGIVYGADTSTNVCPSIHVLGAMGVLFAALQLPRLKTRGWRAFFLISTILIILSTVFLKQHSVIDAAAALPLSALGWWLCFRPRKPRKQRTV